MKSRQQRFVLILCLLTVLSGACASAQTGFSATSNWAERALIASLSDPTVGVFRMERTPPVATSSSPVELADFRAFEGGLDYEPKSISKCCGPPWGHYSGPLAEVLYLRPRNTEVSYALPLNGNVPQGPVGILDPDYAAGFRVGYSKCLDDCRSFMGTYSWFQSNTNSNADTTGGSLAKLLVHPNEANAANNAVTSFGSYDINFQTADLDYRFLFVAGDHAAINLFVGAQYGHLDEALSVFYTNAGITENVATNIGFDGAGIRLGADFASYHCSGLFAYGKTSASFLAGEFSADYLHSTNVDPVRVATSWKAGRVVSILALEVGVGFQTDHCWRFSAGYMFNTWLGAVKTDDWISAVRFNDTNFRDLSDRLTFDGLVARAEYRF